MARLPAQRGSHSQDRTSSMARYAALWMALLVASCSPGASELSSPDAETPDAIEAAANSERTLPPTMQADYDDER